jgi:hypothetical protein
MSCVGEILKIDKSFRFSGVTDDIYTIEAVNPFDSSVKSMIVEPILVQSNKYLSKLIDSQGTFNELFYQKFELLKSIDFTNMIVAGGAVRNVLSQESELPSDIDIFFYGMESEDEATNKADEIIKEIMEITDDDILVTITNNVINILIENNVKIQIIMRLYSSISEILHGFDLGSSAVGFDGKHTYFTTLSKFSYENMVNIVDTTRRSTSYEYRLVKYFNYGFDIVIPNLNIAKYVDESTDVKRFNLKYLPFEYTKIEENRITISNFDNIPNDISDYDDGIGDINYDEEVAKYYSQYLNFIKIINYKPIVYYMKMDTASPSIRTVHKNRITEYTIKDNYLNLKYNLEAKGKADINKIKHNFTVENPKDIIEKIYFSDMNDDQRYIYVYDLIERQISASICAAAPYFDYKYVPEWIIDDPMSQHNAMLTGSFNPIIEEPEKWF